MERENESEASSLSQSIINPLVQLTRINVAEPAECRKQTENKLQAVSIALSIKPTAIAPINRRRRTETKAFCENEEAKKQKPQVKWRPSRRRHLTAIVRLTEPRKTRSSMYHGERERDANVVADDHIRTVDSFLFFWILIYGFVWCVGVGRWRRQRGTRRAAISLRVFLLLLHPRPAQCVNVIITITSWHSPRGYWILNRNQPMLNRFVLIETNDAFIESMRCSDAHT